MVTIDNKEQKGIDFIIENFTHTEYFTDESNDYFVFLYNLSLVCDTFVKVSKKDLLTENLAKLNIDIVNFLTQGYSLEASLNNALTPIVIARLMNNNYSESISNDPHLRVFTKN